MAHNKIPRGVWLLGLVSLCMDLSSEMIHALLPVFMKTVLGVGMETIGLIEGLGEATASITKMFSGVLSDRFARRKPLVLVGYALAALTKPLFPLAQSAAWVLVARFVDRVGKGIRGAPRDALIADLTEPDARGTAFGLRQALDTAGALLGPLVALGLLAILSGDSSSRFRTVFWIAVIPAFVAVTLLALFVSEPADGAPQHLKRGPVRLRDAKKLSGAFWFVVAVGVATTLARFSEAFLILRANDLGLALEWTPLALATMNVTYVASAYPFGKLADRLNRYWLLASGMAMLALADILLAFGNTVAVTFIGIALWGLHMGMTQGLFAAIVADKAPPDLRGSAFGVFNCASGIAALFSSLFAGVLWNLGGPQLTFLGGAAFSAIAFVALAGRAATRPRH